MWVGPEELGTLRVGSPLTRPYCDVFLGSFPGKNVLAYSRVSGEGK